MPPRIPQALALRPSRQIVLSPCTAYRLASTVAQKKRKHQDPYALAQTRARRAANLSRQATLQAERSKALGDPVRGVTTPFVESFDTALPLSPAQTTTSPKIPPSTAASSTTTASASGPDLATAPTSDHLNHFVSASALRSGLKYSTDLTAPISRANEDPQRHQSAVQKHAADAANAELAMTRIFGVENSNSKDRTRINIQRCIETFGRHNTDKTLRSRPNMPPRGESGSVEESGGAEVKDADRAGPDTGSSEVQAAILTAKIRTLANYLETKGRKDKMNKRNLRLLVHRRQKLLRYLRRKERGGERWTHLIETLGLTEGTWRGEISL